MANSRIKKQNGLRGCATTEISQLENNRKLGELQTSEKQN